MDINYTGEGNLGQGGQPAGQAGVGQTGAVQAGAGPAQQQQPYILNAQLATVIFLVASLINNLNVTKNDQVFIVAAITGITANILFVKSAFGEARVQQVSPGVTTTANQLKMAGTSIALIAALILFSALIIEVNLKAQGVTAQTITPAQATAGATGAVLAGA